MATIKSFEDMDLWQKSRQLSLMVFNITQEEKFSKDYPLKDQIRRASGSVMDNIAEGFGRGGRKEFIQFLSISKGSAEEVRSQLYRAYDQKYIDEVKFKEMNDFANQISKMIIGFIFYLRESDIKGIKYKQTDKSPDIVAEWGDFSYSENKLNIDIV